MNATRIQEYFANKSVGIVFSGGGARGFAHLGVMQYFEEVGIRPNYLVGSSAGALVAVCLAAGKSAKETTEYFLKRNLLKSAFKLSIKGVLDAKKIVNEVLDFAGVKRFSDLVIPIAVNAMNINTGKEKVFRRGSLQPALEATISLPLVFFPAKVKNSWYVDGSAIDVVPEHLLPPCDISIAVDITLPPAKISKYSSQWQVFGNTLLFSQLRGISESVVSDLYIRLKLPGFSLLEYAEKKHKQMVKFGYKEAKKNLKSYLKKKKV